MPRYFCRVCYNSKQWRQPSGCARRVEGPTFAATYGFAWEEWNFDFSRHTVEEDSETYKLGWIEGFYADEPGRNRHRVDSGSQEVMLYTHIGTQYCVIARVNCWHFGTACEHDVDLVQMADEVNAIGGCVEVIDETREARSIRPAPDIQPHPFLFRPNVRYRFEDCYFTRPIPIDVYDRYGPVQVTRERESQWERVRHNWAALDTPVELPPISE